MEPNRDLHYEHSYMIRVAMDMVSKSGVCIMRVSMIVSSLCQQPARCVHKLALWKRSVGTLWTSMNYECHCDNPHHANSHYENIIISMILL
jgi:hypothetical protein